MIQESNNIHGFDVYAEVINIELFNATLAVAACTSEVARAGSIYRHEILPTVIFGEHCTAPLDYFARYGLRYMGEIVERFEEHFGAGPENLRAVALALGYSLPVLSPSMFIGAQKENFLRRLDREAGQDIYLQGARYLLETDPATRRHMLEKLSSAAYGRTEEALFILSLFPETEAGFEVMRPQLVRLLGRDRTLPVIGNIRVLEWLIMRYQKVIAACRKKDNAALRALVKLPFQALKAESASFQALTDAGYSELEIWYARARLISSSQIPGAVSSGSIPGEKAAAQFCVAALNQREDPADEILNYVGYLFQLHKKFQIRYQENNGIWNAVSAECDPANPKTVLWMLRETEVVFDYQFDVFDPEWDILAKELEPDTYTPLFEAQMLRLESPTKEGLQRYLAHYRDLTGRDYRSAFGEQRLFLIDSFKLLVDQGVVDLWSYFNEHVAKGKESKELNYIIRYVERVNTPKAFAFLQKLVAEYPFAELPSVFGRDFRFHRRFLNNNGYRITLDIERNFLSADDQRQLFEWVDRSVFCTEPDIYYKFIAYALHNPCVRSIYDRETLSQVLKALIRTDYKMDDMSGLKQALFTAEELEAERAAKEAEWARHKKEQQELQLARKREKLESVFDGTIVSIERFLKSYYMDSEQTQAIQIAYSRLKQVVDQFTCPVPLEEAATFLRICGAAVQTEAIPKEEVYSLVGTLLKEECKNAAND